jgi:hypothetical protein
MCISIDLRKYGNEARFVRRSCKANSEIRHIVGKGTLHTYIVTLKALELDEEITILHEFQTITKGLPNHDYSVAPFPLPCACVDVTTCTARFNDSPGALGISDVSLTRRNGAIVVSPVGSTAIQSSE